MTDLLEYLQSKGLQLKTANGANVNTTCWYHGEDPADRGRLYINVDPGSGAYGAFKCFVCDERGGLNKLRAHFGDPPLKTANPQAKPDDLPDDTYLGILHAAAEYYHEQLGEHPEAYEYLRQERGLTHETITRFRLGWATGNGLVTHLSKRFQLEDIQRTGLVNEWGESFFRDKITIPYYVVGQCVQVRGKEIGGKYLTPPGQKARLFNPDAALEERVVIAEGEFDTILLEQMGYHAMGVPGANTWQDGWTGLLSEAKRVYICFDNDRAGRAGAEKLSTKLGPKSRIVEMPEPLPGQKKIDVSEWVVTYGKGRDDFEFLFSKASGGLLVSVAQAYERWTEVEGNPDLVGLRFNIDQLDAQMRHGLLPGQVFTIIAKTNCLAGDSELIVNRLGTVKFCTLAQLAENFGEWSKLGPVETQHMAEDGSIRTARIKDVWAAGRKQVLQLRTHLGFTVRATAEHRFKVEDGWAQLGDLVVGDHVTVSSEGRGRLDRVVDISPAGEVETYDVEMVAEPHNFVANGFVVHNSGKTLASLNMFHRMALLRPDIKILFFSLEQTRNEWFERARRIHTFYDPWSTIDDTIRWWSDKLWLVDKNRINEDELVSCIDQFEYETGQLPDLVCVDYLGYYARGLRGDEYERTTAAIMGLKSVAKDKQVVVMAPHQVNRTGQFGKHLSADQAKSSGAVEETSDLLMSLFRPDQQVDKSTEDYTGEIHMQILKSRDGPTGSEIVFQFAPKTLAIVPNTDPRVSRLLRERVWARNGQSWEQCLYRYRTGDESTMFLDPAEVERVIRMTKSEYMANKNT